MMGLQIEPLLLDRFHPNVECTIQAWFEAHEARRGLKMTLNTYEGAIPGMIG